MTVEQETDRPVQSLPSYKRNKYKTEIDRLIEARKLEGPQSLVDVARSEDSPLHDAFEWDDAVAGEAHRRNQASGLMRYFRVEIGPKRAVVPAFARVQYEGEKPRYERMEKIVESPSLLAQIVAQTEEQCLALEAKLSAFKELAETRLSISRARKALPKKKMG